MSLPRSLPFSDESEKAVLSAIMNDPAQCLPFAIERVKPDAFYHPANRLLYELLVEMHAKGIPIELPAVCEYAITKGILERLGGPAAISEILGVLMTSAHLSYYVKILTSHAQQRRGIDVCTKALEKAMAPQEAEEVQQWSATLVENAIRLHEQTINPDTRKARSFAELRNAVVDSHGRPENRGISTGFPWLDTKMGGCQKGRVVVIAGGTSDGKSALALQILGNMAANGNAGSLFSLEMPGEEVFQRTACQRADIRSSVWQDLKMTQCEMKNFTEFSKVDLPFEVHDDVDDINEIAAQIRIDKARRNIRWVVIDYLQLCVADASGNNREREVATCSRVFKRLAMNLGLTIIVLSQLNEQGRLRESRAIGQDADHVVVISTDNREDERILKLGKNRGGQRNVSCRYRFEGQYFRFEEGVEI